MSYICLGFFSFGALHTPGIFGSVASIRWFETIGARVYNLGDNRSATSPYSTLVGGPVERVVDLRKKSRSEGVFGVVFHHSGVGYGVECFKWSRCYVCNMRLRCFCSTPFLVSSSNDIWGKPHGLAGLAPQWMRWNAMDAMDAMARWVMRE